MPAAPAPPRARPPRVDESSLAHLVAARTDRMRVARRRGGEFVNDYADRPWEDGLSGRPFTVYLADTTGVYRTLALDLDAKPGTDPAADARRLAALLDEAGVRHVEAVSGPTGGRHLIATFSGGLPARRVRAVALALRAKVVPSLDVTPLCNPATGSIRPPGAAHRLGGASQLLTPPEAAARVLRAGNDVGSFDTLSAMLGLAAEPVMAGLRPAANRRAPRPLPPHIVALGHADPGLRANRSAVAAAVCLGFVNAGRPFAEFERAALDRAWRGLDHLRRVRQGSARFNERAPAQARAAAERMWRGRVAFAERNPPGSTGGGAAKAVAAVLAAMDAEPDRFGGQAGPTDRQVLCALLDIALRCGRLTVSASVRQLAEQTGVTKSSTARALQRLRSDGWLTLASSGAGTDAAAWKINPPPSSDAATPQAGLAAAQVAAGTLARRPLPLPSSNAEPLRLTVQSRLADAVTIHSDDALSGDGLGRVAAVILAALHRSPATAASLSARTGLRERTARRHLERLVAAGVARRAGHVWQARGLRHLRAAAARLGAAGAGVRRAAGHAADRATYRWWLADHLAGRGWTAERGLYRAGHHTLTGRDKRSVPSDPVATARRGGRPRARVPGGEQLDLFAA